MYFNKFLVTNFLSLKIRTLYNNFLCQIISDLIDFAAVCGYIIQHGNFTNDYQQCLSYIFGTIEVFTTTDARVRTNTEFINLEHYLNLMKYLLESKANDFKIHNKLIICFINYLWTCIKHETFFPLEKFIKQNGLYLLLDILEVKYFRLRYHIGIIITI